MPDDYSFSWVNGTEVANQPGLSLLGTAGADDFTLFTASLQYFGLPLVRVLAGDGDDSIYGDGVTVFAGAGNDRFLSTGTDGHLMARYGANQLFGQAGHDAAYDHVGSTDFFGGSGNDTFSTWQPGIGINHSFSGDVDRAFMGRGTDTAFVSVEASYDTSGAVVIEDRRIIVDGGSGYDTLILRGVVAQGSIHSPANGIIDLRLATTGTLALNNFEASGFEALRVSFSIHSSATILGTDGHDVIELNGTSPLYSDPAVPDPFETVVVRAGLGDDTLIGSHDQTSERLSGQDGNDFIALSGRSPWIDAFDFAFGGNGNDILTVDGVTVTDFAGRMYGGAGYDTFLITLAGEGQRIIEDFVRGEDRILLDAVAWWSNPDAFNRAEVHAHTQRGWNATLIEDTAEVLQFTFTAPDFFGVLRDHLIRYDRETGVLEHDFRISGSPWDIHRDWDVMGRVTGAPDLALGDFGFLL